MDKVEPDVFLPLLRRHITGPLDSMMRSALVEASIQFCRKSRYLVDSLTISGVVAGQDITICSDIDLKSSDIQSVIDDEGNILSGGIDYLAISANQLKALRDIGTMMIGYCIEPRQTATNIPQPLFDDHAEAIAYGAASILYLKPGMPWTDGNRAKLYDTEFTEGVIRASRFRLEQSKEPIQNEFSNPVRVRDFF